MEEYDDQVWDNAVIEIHTVLDGVGWGMIGVIRAMQIVQTEVVSGIVSMRKLVERDIQRSCYSYPGFVL